MDAAAPAPVPFDTKAAHQEVIASPVMPAAGENIDGTSVASGLTKPSAENTAAQSAAQKSTVPESPVTEAGVRNTKAPDAPTPAPVLAAPSPTNGSSTPKEELETTGDLNGREPKMVPKPATVETADPTPMATPPVGQKELPLNKPAAENSSNVAELATIFPATATNGVTNRNGTVEDAPPTASLSDSVFDASKPSEPTDETDPHLGTKHLGTKRKVGEVASNEALSGSVPPSANGEPAEKSAGRLSKKRKLKTPTIEDAAQDKKPSRAKKLKEKLLAPIGRTARKTRSQGPA